MEKDDLNAVLADLKRQREDLERRIRAHADTREDTAGLVERLKQLRERREQIINALNRDDPMRNTKR